MNELLKVVYVLIVNYVVCFLVEDGKWKKESE